MNTSSSVKLSFLGDCSVQDISLIKVGSEISSLLSSRDLVSCNLEGPIIDPKSTNRDPFKVGSVLFQDQFIIEYLQRLGVSFFSLANNHIADYGMQGIHSTIEKICSLSLSCHGASPDFNGAYENCIKDISGLRMGFLSFGEAEFGAWQHPNSKRGGFAWINHPYARKLIRDTAIRVDCLVVQVHAGIEESIIPLPEWRLIYQEIIELGADAVISHHPHIVQGWEIYKSKPIFYSLGNFLFQKDRYLNCKLGDGMILNLIARKKNIEIENIYLLKAEGNSLQIDESPQGASMLTERCNLIGNEDKIDKLAIKLWSDYYRSYYRKSLLGLTLPEGVSQFSFFKNQLKYRSLLLLHNIRFESHRFLCERALSILYE